MNRLTKFEGRIRALICNHKNIAIKNSFGYKALWELEREFEEIVDEFEKLKEGED